MPKSHPLKPTHRKAAGSATKSAKSQKKHVIFNQFKPKKSTAISPTLVPVVDNDEYLLLFRLFIPSYVIKNNTVSDKVSVTQLMRFLPNLVPDGVTTGSANSNLNLQLHLFQASMVVKYIHSWYLTKLNTDDFHVIVKIYLVVSQLTQSIVARVYLLHNPNSVVSMVDSTAAILESHISELAKQNSDDVYDLKILNDYVLRSDQRNSVRYTRFDSQAIINEYLATRHVIFEPGNDQRLVYFRVLISNVLQLTFQHQSPMTSKIISTLVVSLISDLVLNKVFEKLASPEFVLGLVYKVARSLNENLDSRLNAPKASLTSKVKSIGSITQVWSWSLPRSKLNQDIMQSKVFALFNTVSNFSSRAPYCSSLLAMASTVIQNSSFLNSMVNSIAASYVEKGLKSAPFTTDFVCSMISDLRRDLFQDGGEKNPEKNDNGLTFDEVVDEVYLLTEKVKRVLPFPDGFLYYKKESPQECKQSIRNLLSIFNYSGDSSDNEIHDSCELNQLFVVEILDSLIRQLFPEL